MKIEEVLKQITDKQHRIAVLEDLVGYLEEFLPSDAAPEPEEKLFTEQGFCLDPRVSDRAFESVIDDINKLVSAERKELTKLTSLETKTNGRTATKSRPRKSSNANSNGRGAKK